MWLRPIWGGHSTFRQLHGCDQRPLLGWGRSITPGGGTLRWSQPLTSVPVARGPMSEKQTPIAVDAAEVPVRSKPSAYPEPFASRMAGREKRPLGDFFGLTNFGVNLTRLAPNSVSALRHAHSRQDEFVYILRGRPTLHTDEGRTQLSPGMCAGFKAGTRNRHPIERTSSGKLRLPPVAVHVERRAPGDCTFGRHALSPSRSPGLSL